MIEPDGYERRQVEPLILSSLVYCILLFWTKEASALADFSGYLTKLLQNHTVSACDGEHLTLQCPRHSTISVQSAFYGLLGESYQKCTEHSPETMHLSNTQCLAKTAFQKVLDECQNIRSCQLPVNSRVFGPDPCPGITKYLQVSYKCKPTEYKSISVCENNQLKLHCKEPKLLNIYSAVYGRFAHEKNSCLVEMDQLTPYDCLSYAALDVLSQRCYGKQRCKMMVSDGHFGSPCMPGVIKSLTINYSCDLKLNPHESRLPNRDVLFVSSCLAAIAYIRDHPETAALFFVSSVCIGLLVTLFALVIRVSWRKDLRNLQKMNGHVVTEKDCEDTAVSSSDEEEDASSQSHFSEEFRELCKNSHPINNRMDAADLAERIERREQIIQEIWMNSGLDLPPHKQTNFYF
ncbi:protein eva-1 homolog C isoform X2 [Bombina bombina]|uniref:protein eva-1 homolog C isoform X2 n=1 Tax=Bombina bombina TaxID=8345 RepID=UPI00235A6B98|nr:protein eva-1 homolog C isoform X2 [Bombina bombina]